MYNSEAGEGERIAWWKNGGRRRAEEERKERICVIEVICASYLVLTYDYMNERISYWHIYAAVAK